MTYTRTLFMLLGFAAALFAADPYAGNWKLNVGKSKYKTGTLPKEQTLTIVEAGANLDIKVNSTPASGPAVTFNYVVPAAGGNGKVIGTGAYDGVSGKRIAPNEREISYMKGGKAVYTSHSKISADGKSLTAHVKGLNAMGQMVEGEAHYDKQ